MINQAVDNAPYDKTRAGTVLERNEDNTYTIKVDGVTYRKIAIMDGLRADIGDIVKVVIPTNNPSQMFISTVRYTTETTSIGEIKMYAGNNEPKGWLLCDGRELLINDYPKLYNVIGDVYGTASDANHFVLPDLRGRTPIGVGQGTGLTSRSLGDKVGAETHKLKGNESGQKSVSISSSGGHTHTITSYYRETVNYSSGSAARPYSQSGSKTTTGWASIASDTGKHTHSISESDATNAHNNMQPSLGINFLIYHGQH